MDFKNMMFAYLAPETILPVTSVVATAVGVVLMFGRNAFRIVVRWLRLATIRRARTQALRGPHFLPGTGVKNQARRGQS